jgi:glycerol-3-phosphate dehydrogenase
MISLNCPYNIVIVLAGAWVSQAERVAKIAADRLYLTQVILAQGLDATADLRSSLQELTLVAFFIPKGDWTICPMS